MKLLNQTSRPKLLLAAALVFAVSLSVPLMGSSAGQTAAASEARLQAWFIPFFGIVCKGECKGGFCCTLTPF